MAILGMCAHQIPTVNIKSTVIHPRLTSAVTEVSSMGLVSMAFDAMEIEPVLLKVTLTSTVEHKVTGPVRFKISVKMTVKSTN